MKPRVRKSGWWWEVEWRDPHGYLRFAIEDSWEDAMDTAESWLAAPEKEPCS